MVPNVCRRPQLQPVVHPRASGRTVHLPHRSLPPAMQRTSSKPCRTRTATNTAQLDTLRSTEWAAQHETYTLPNDSRLHISALLCHSERESQPKGPYTALRFKVEVRRYTGSVRAVPNITHKSVPRFHIQAAYPCIGLDGPASALEQSLARSRSLQTFYILS